jgi:hypothetical protein
VRYTCASGPEACVCCSGRSLLVAHVATPEHPVSLPHYCGTFYRPDAPLGGRRDDSLREQGPDCMEDVVERFISVSGWFPWCDFRLSYLVIVTLVNYAVILIVS